MAILLIILAVVCLLLAGFRTYSIVCYNRKRKRHRRTPKGQYTLSVLLSALALVLLLGAILLFRSSDKAAEVIPVDTTPVSEPMEVTEPTEPELTFQPYHTKNSDPGNWDITWEVFQNETILTNYARKVLIRFRTPEDYFALPGIGAFRGNASRTGGTYGTARVTDAVMTELWAVQTGQLPGTNWSGSGWTGQPLIVKWDENTRKIMNLYPEKRDKVDLVEVIYATLDGNIYFLDLDDGSYTRDPIHVGLCFKGAGALDPRGYPLMYVGAGDANADGERPRMFIISLIDGSILFSYGDHDTMSLRKDNNGWCAFDSSPLVHGDTDTLIWPGENGILYTMKLNTTFDITAGTIHVAPSDMVCARYTTGRSTDDHYWRGFEASACMMENYLYVSENGGMFYCIDINTMELVWAQDTKDDSNSSPVFELVGNDRGYIYTAPSLHWTQDENATGEISIYKLDALNGDILWEKPYQVHTVTGVSGGVQATGLLGKDGTDLEGLIIYPVARTPERETGVLVALKRENGEVVWEVPMDKYAWSSPVALYTQSGTAYIVAFDASGYGYLLEGATGEVLDKIPMGGFVEATPAVYENILVVGTKEKSIRAIQIQ